MSRSSRSVGDSFVNAVQQLEKTRARLEALAASGELRKSDLNQWYEASYLRMVTLFEVMLEQLFFGLLCQRLTTSINGVRPLIKVTSPRVAWQIVLQRNPYLDWLPFDKSRERAKQFFSLGKPFTLLDGTEVGYLTHGIAIRNAIAHRSKFAIKKFRSQVLSGLILPPHQKTPSGFLRSQYRINPAETRFEFYAAQFVLIAKKLCG